MKKSKTAENVQDTADNVELEQMAQKRFTILESRDAELRDLWPMSVMVLKSEYVMIYVQKKSDIVELFNLILPDSKKKMEKSI